jgi:TolB-like protein/tetratricopeptide (TPR) repeat protein
MNELAFRPHAVRFGTFEVDLKSHELRKHGLRLRLEEKPFQILELLLERPGQVITRRALREKLWPDTHVGYEHSLNTAISKLRDLLGDSAQSPRFIETLPRLGYRFIAPVLKSSSADHLNGRKMLAVLPLEDLGGNSDEEYFAEGLTEELISHLGQLDPKRLGVIARTSAIQYKATKKSVGQIAQELNVGYVLEGSVRREGQRVRITAQLIEGQDQTHLWSASYDRKFDDMLGMQADVAREVGKALSCELLPEDPEKSVAFHPTAHEAYLRGRFYFGQRSEESVQKALASFELALRIETNCSRSLSGVADCRGLLCWFGALSPGEAGPRAAAAATRAIEIDPSLSEPHASLGLVKFWYEWNWQAAEEEFRRAIELNPSYASARQWYASYLSAMGRLDEAQGELRRARELDPHSLTLNMNAADPFFFGRQFDRAAAHLNALLEQEPRFLPALFNLGRIYIQQGRYDEAIAAFDYVAQLSGNSQGRLALAQAYGYAGEPDEARRILRKEMENGDGRYLASPMIAQIYLSLGEDDKAFEWLRRGIEERSFWIVFLKMDPAYDSIRSDHRFHDLLKLARFAMQSRSAA